MQRRLHTETGENKPFENVLCQGPIQHYFREGAPIFVTFSSVVFFGRVNFKQLKYQKRLQGGPIACSPGKFLKICILYANGHFSAF